MLLEANYPTDKRKYLVDGFRNGFDLCYEGSRRVRRTASNLPFRVGTPFDLWQKVMIEVKAKRYAGPYLEHDIPFRYFIQSPVGLVPKDKGTKTRLIFHLSHPKDGPSVNAGIPTELCKVSYPDFTEAVSLCLNMGKNAACAKSDMSMAFRHVPLMKKCWHLLVLKATHPVTKVTHYFFDKSLPFGSGISCAVFQSFSDSVAYLVKFRTGMGVINYLDDYLFVDYIKTECNKQVMVFLNVCKNIQFPVSLEKTFWACTRLVFLGLMLDTVEQTVSLPREKVNKAMNLIDQFLGSRKVTVFQVQQLCSVLNFMCKCIVPGRTFLHRLYSIAPSCLKSHHHVSIKTENKLDLQMWQHFLQYPAIYKRPFIDMCNLITSEDIGMYSDASASLTKGGFGAFCGANWISQKWDRKFLEACNPSIEYLELYGVAVAVLSWIRLFPNKNLCLYTDNESVKFMINKSSSGCKNCMVLLRLITLECMKCNVRLFALWVDTKTNAKADALSRGDLARFRKIAKGMNEFPDQVPVSLWPVSKIWMY